MAETTTDDNTYTAQLDQDLDKALRARNGRSLAEVKLQVKCLWEISENAQLIIDYVANSPAARPLRVKDPELRRDCMSTLKELRAAEHAAFELADAFGFADEWLPPDPEYHG